MVRIQRGRRNLCAVDRVAEDTATVDTMRIHLLAAEGTSTAGADARHQHMIALLEQCDRCADAVDHADALMPENAGLGRSLSSILLGPV